MSRPTPLQFLQHMEIPSLRGIFILGSFERRVTLYSQQVRALNLAFSLSQEQRLPPGSKVLVIGGGAAGLTFAAGAARRGASVTLLERLGDVLSTFRGNHTRWLHPHIYEWPRSGSTQEHARLPLLDWSADQAGEVARELLAQWRRLKEELGIRVLCRAKDIRRVSSTSGTHTFSWNAPGFDSDRFSTVVFAVGFGEERQIPGVATPQYWKNDALHQPISSPSNRFLVSGIGDGGVVDLLRLRLEDFQHDQIVRQLLSGSELKPLKSALLDIEKDISRSSLPPEELHQRYVALPVPESFHQNIRERLRGDTRVVLNSPEAYPLSASASVLNRFLLSQLLVVDQLEYRQGTIQKVEHREDGSYTVHFDSSTPDDFDHVIVRHGARSALERDFPWLWKEVSTHLRSINTLDQTRDPLWEDDRFFAQKQALASASPTRMRTPPLPNPDSLVGRKKEVKQLIEELLAPSPTPVVVRGPPGIGKSTLALAALGDTSVENHYGDRRYFARLDGADTVDAIFARIAREMGVTSVSDISAQVLSKLDEAPTLLVLDNADSPWLQDRPGTENLLRMLASMPALALVITLRGKERPDLGGIPSLAVTVPPLTLEESRILFGSIVDDVPLNHPGLDDMLQKMGGVALAVKLLAKQAEGVDLEITLQRWQDESTAMLQSDSDQGSSIPASIEASLKSPRLSERALRLLSVLALLPAGMAEKDRSSILPESASAIALLQKAALVEREGRRWRLLFVIREHVRKTRALRDDDRKSTIDFYFSLAQRLGPQVGKANGREAFNVLFEEIDNIEELLLMMLREEEVDAAIETTLQVSDFVRFSGRGTARPLEEARKVAKRQGATVKEAQCLLALSRLHLLRRPRYDRARQLLLEALELFKQAGEPQGEADCFRELGHTAANEYELEEAADKLEQAEDYFQRALAMQTQFRDPIGEAYCRHGLARVARFRGKYEDARRLFGETLQLFRNQEDLLGQAYSLRHLGELEENDGHLRMACELFEEVGELRNLGHCLRSRSELAWKRGQFDEAEQLCRKALDWFLKLQAAREAAWCRISLAQVLLHARSASTEVRELLERSLESARELNDKKCEAECHRLLRQWGSSPG